MAIFRINSIVIIEPLARSKRNNDVISQVIYDDIFFYIFYMPRLGDFDIFKWLPCNVSLVQ